MAKSILKSVHDTAKGLHKAGAMDEVTMREFDALCLPPEKNYTQHKSDICDAVIKRASRCLQLT